MDKTLKLIPLYSLLLIFASFFSVSSYYNRFGLEIYYYVELSDLLIQTLPVFKSIAIALFIVFLNAGLSFITGYLQVMFASPRKLIAKKIIKNERAASNSHNAEKKRTIRQKIWDYEIENIGFHLITEIEELFNKSYRRRLSKREFTERVIVCSIGTIIVMFSVGFAVYFWINRYIDIIRGNRSFYQNTGESITLIIGLPILTLIILSSVLGAKFLKKNVFNNFLRLQNIVFISIGIYLATSMLNNYANFLFITKEKTNDQVSVYLNNHIIYTNKNGFKFIGRTKNFVFISNMKISKAINISNADSVVVKADNGIK